MRSRFQNDYYYFMATLEETFATEFEKRACSGPVFFFFFTQSYIIVVKYNNTYCMVKRGGQYTVICSKNDEKVAQIFEK